MLFMMRISALLALMSSHLVHSWNATIYESANCTGSRYVIYPTAEHTKYFEMEGSFGAGMECTYHGTRNNGTATGTACNEQFPVARSVFSDVGSCNDYSGPHSSGERVARQTEGQCMTTDFDIRSVVCFDRHHETK
ncbi:hypothetical protein GGS20DRAFT_489689 [Poronia punctata]|nr:hypothetical protein GGS20DRAFT_489689 [Poronia punctata]